MDAAPEAGDDHAGSSEPESGNNRPPLRIQELTAEDFLSAAGIPRIDVVAQTGSTNADLLRNLRLEPAQWPDLAVLTTEHQTAGRGRLERQWEAPPRSSLAVSIVLRPVTARGLPVPTRSYAWLSLLAALALRESLLQVEGIPAELKWPNDVLVRGKKISGILAQLTTMADGAAPAVVLGTGINVSLEASELPVATATSVVVERGATHAPSAGAMITPDRTKLLKSFLTNFSSLYRAFCNADGDPSVSLLGGGSLHHRAEAVMVTLGREIRVQLPGGTDLIGRAEHLDADGSLMVVSADGDTHTVTAGDVIHVRPWSTQRGMETGYA